MRTEAIVMKPAAFDAWVKQQAKSLAPGSSSTSSSASGLSVFNSSGCSSCHTLSAANATGTIGPDLDKLVSYAQQAHQPLASFVPESIVNPNAYIQPGYHPNLMPQTFGSSLSKAQLGALVSFLVQAAQQASKKG
jgi:cytochrome c551/c552